jgi:hypothetical protein
MELIRYNGYEDWAPTSTSGCSDMATCNEFTGPYIPVYRKSFASNCAYCGTQHEQIGNCINCGAPKGEQQ